MSILLLLTTMFLGQPGVVTMSDLEEPPDQAMLSNTALCFFDAVGFLQKTPVSPGDYSLLLLEAKEILEGIGVRLGEGDFSTLAWDAESLHVITPSGFLIECDLVSEEHDSTEEGSTIFLMYSFSIPAESLSDTVTVELSI